MFHVRAERAELVSPRLPVRVDPKRVAVVLWARRIGPVIKIVTVFTIAHSTTLSLAALKVIVIPGTIVEPAIAASIVYVAMENFFTRNIDDRWRVAFAFGLVHGFGFASLSGNWQLLVSHARI